MSNSSDVGADAGAGEPPLPLLLARLAAELGAQAGAVDALHCLAEAAPRSPERGAERLRAAQSIDVVAQHLRALADVLAGLSASVPAGEGVPAGIIDAVPLSDLAERLRGRAAGAPAGDDDDGAFELL